MSGAGRVILTEPTQQQQRKKRYASSYLTATWFNDCSHQQLHSIHAPWSFPQKNWASQSNTWKPGHSFHIFSSPWQGGRHKNGVEQRGFFHPLFTKGLNISSLLHLLDMEAVFIEHSSEHSAAIARRRYFTSSILRILCCHILWAICW